MKLLYDADILRGYAGGIAKATVYLYKACLDIMPDLDITGIHRKPISYPLPVNIKSVHLKGMPVRELWRAMAFPSYIFMNKPDIVHFPGNGIIPSLYSDIKVATTFHDVLPIIIPDCFKSQRHEKKYYQKTQKDINKSDILFTISEYSKREIIKNFRVKNEPIVIPHGSTLIPETPLDPILDLNRTDDYFLYTGRYDKRKGIESMIKVFLDLHKEKKLSSKLILTGKQDYYSQELRELITTGITLGVVEEKGYVTDQEIIRLIHKARALIYPSKYEGFGLPALEAMSLGCPVITTKYSSIPEICEDAAYYVEPDNKRCFADGLICLETNTQLRKEFILKGKKQADKFSWDKTAKIFLDKLLELKSK